MSITSIFSSIKGDVSRAFHYVFSPATEAKIMEVETETVQYIPVAMSILSETASLLGPSPLISELQAVAGKLLMHITVPGDPTTAATPHQLATVLQAVATEGLQKALPNASPGAVQKAAAQAVSAIHAISNT